MDANREETPRANNQIARWDYITSILNINSFKMDGVNFWGHNDADMLEVGNSGLSLEEARSHFAFWAAMKSPLIMSADLTTLSDEYIAILQNKHLIAFNQDDSYGSAANPYKWGFLPDYTWNETYPAQYWSGDSKHGIFVLVLNTGDDTEDMTINFGEVPYLGANRTRYISDAWSGDHLGSSTNSITVSVDSHDNYCCFDISTLQQHILTLTLWSDVCNMIIIGVKYDRYYLNIPIAKIQQISCRLLWLSWQRKNLISYLWVTSSLGLLACPIAISCCDSLPLHCMVLCHTPCYMANHVNTDCRLLRLSWYSRKVLGR